MNWLVSLRLTGDILEEFVRFSVPANFLKSSRRGNVSYYYNSYLNVLKREFMLVIIALFLLVVTFFVWAGVPVFIIGSAVANLTTSQFLVNLCVSFSVAIIFSLYFYPLI